MQDHVERSSIAIKNEASNVNGSKSIIKLGLRPSKRKIYGHDMHSKHKRYLDTLKEEFINNYTNPVIYTKSVEDFDKLKSLGRGSFGNVILVRDMINLEYYAMKALEKRSVVENDLVKQVFKEKLLLQSVKFPFIVTLNCCCKDNCYIYFLFSFEGGGELYSLMKKLGCFSEHLAQFYAAQMVLALEYLHHCSIIHRDLKPENILISQSGYLKLCDFGFAKLLKKRTWTLCGTPEYLAPEVILSKGYSFSVDWWSLGVLIFEMQAGYPPFYHPEPVKLYEKILEGKFKSPNHMTSSCKSLLKNLLQVDVMKRFGTLLEGVFDIKSHLWFQEILWDELLLQKLLPPYIPDCNESGSVGDNCIIAADVKLKTSPICLYEEEFKNF